MPARRRFGFFAGYGVALTAGLITGGRLGDVYGRRRMFGIGLALFTLASLGCGLAPTATDLVLARIVQGVGAALLVPRCSASSPPCTPVSSARRPSPPTAW